MIPKDVPQIRRQLVWWKNPNPEKSPLKEKEKKKVDEKEYLWQIAGPSYYLSKISMNVNRLNSSNGRYKQNDRFKNKALLYVHTQNTFEQLRLHGTGSDTQLVKLSEQQASRCITVLLEPKQLSTGTNIVT